MTLVLAMTFLDMTTKSQATETKIKQDYIKLKNFFTAKETVSKVKRQHTEWKKIFANHISDMESISKICNSYNSITKKPNNQIKK